MSLSSERVFLLKLHHNELCDAINISSSLLVDYLRERDVISLEEDEYIRGNSTPPSTKNKNKDEPMVEKLLELLISKSNSAFDIFCDSLHQTKQGHLVDSYLSKAAIDHTVKDLQKCLAGYYEDSFVDDMFSWHDEGHRMALSDIYVPIQWVHYDKTPAGTKEVPLKDYHDVFRCKEESQGPQNILVRGAPSAGKTTILRKICYDWASLQLKHEDCSENVSQTLGRFKLIVPIILRLIEENASFDETIRHQMDFVSDTQFLTLKWLIENESSHILFILDGLDEYFNASKEITDLMKGNMLNKVNCLITSRPHAVEKVKQWKRILFREAELLGFDKPHVKLYVKIFFNKIENGSTLAEGLLAEIYPEEKEESINRKLSALQNLATNPGLLCMLCLLYHEKHEVVSYSKEELYQEFVAYILSRWEMKYLKDSQTRTPRDQIMVKYKDLLLKFGRLADIGHREGKERTMMILYFTVAEAEEFVGKDGLNCGFLYKSHPASRLDHCLMSFIHKTIQEYLLAYYLFHTEGDTIVETLTKQMKNMIKMRIDEFVFRILVHIFLSPSQVDVFAREIVRELVYAETKNDPSYFRGFTSYCQTVMSLVDGYDNKGHTFKAWGMEQNKQYMICKLPNYFMTGPPFETKHTAMLQLETSHRFTNAAKPIIKKCYKCTNISDGESLKEKAWNMKVIELSTTEISELHIVCSDTMLLSKIETPSCPRLNVICNKSSSLLIKIDSPDLKEVHISDVKTKTEIYSSGIVQTIKILHCDPCENFFVGCEKTFSKVKDLSINESCFHEQYIRKLVHILTKAEMIALEKLDLSQNNLSRSGREFGHLIMASPRLKELTLIECGWTKADLNDFQHTLKSKQYVHPNLLGLFLNKNNLCDCGLPLQSLLTVLPINCLSLSRCDINNGDFWEIVNGCINSANRACIEILNIGCNNITDVDTLLHLLDHRPKQLTAILIDGNQFGDRLIELTKYADKLKELRQDAWEKQKLDYANKIAACGLSIENTGMSKNNIEVLVKLLNSIGLEIIYDRITTKLKVMSCRLK